MPEPALGGLIDQSRGPRLDTNALPIPLLLAREERQHHPQKYCIYIQLFWPGLQCSLAINFDNVSVALANMSPKATPHRLGWTLFAGL